METAETVAAKGLSCEAMDCLSERLSLQEDLYFPRALQSTASNPSQRKAILLDLLSRDVAVFLERYGSQLTSNELHEFDALKDDYEINWHLKHLRSIKSPTSDELHTRSVIVKNRRRAYLSKLIYDGQYFSEDAMREREPFLHHEYVGKFQDPSGRGMARPGERWSETLMRRSEEAMLVAKIRGEQRRLGVAERDLVTRAMDDQHERPATENSEGAEGGSNHVATLSEADMQDQMDQFTYIMHQKFLLGEDSEHLDYSKIDNDETLDDHWMREANDDAEEKYFDED
ncbi:coiled-coil domain-containing protein 97 [Cucumis melo var. makuwa]|uniref:Coiled-coil domain-containing protein 97 n=1 Tax=Cucumis melo var. makuwa TaxID=1194695 RepID=A0A5D3CJT9_CUCMM|nr:coiled-coil domain-containing protein 97 [Cucumis melo var. makuwa]